MIIQNGTIEFVTVSGVSLDSETGHPVAGSKEYGEEIPCQYVPAFQSLRQRENGEAVTSLSWTIYIESRWRDVATERIRLKDREGNIVGEYSIIKIEPLDAVCEYRLTV